MKIDLSEFRQTHLQESAEFLESMEADLLALRSAPGDAAILNAIFRAAHSLKGGAGFLGLTNLVRFTHALESLLDCLRSAQVHVTEEVIGLLLQSVDVLRIIIGDCYSSVDECKMPDEALELIQRFEELLAAARQDKRDRMAAMEATSASAVSPGDAAAPTLYRVEFRPHGEMFLSGADPSMLLRNLTALGTVRVCQMDVEDLLTLQELDPLLCHLRWTIELASTAPEETLREIFEFVEHVADIHITPLETSQAASADGDGRRTPEELLMKEVRRSAALRKPASKPVIAAGASSIRVATEKVDRLIELAGEVVSAQGTTTQVMEHFELARLAKLREAVQAMERSTRELQECVMAVRMMPVGPLFQRYARVLYDIARSTGKQMRLDIEGGETEIDKSMLELLSDTLTHLVRNAADHGIESPKERAAAGKREEGVILLRAFPRAGRMVIEVTDDGAGIDTERVRAKAVKQGLMEAGAPLSDEEARMLIFEPGFSTREAVTDLSGRGVGMDVVKRNVERLSGTVGLASLPGQGSTVSMDLPLRLATQARK